MMNEENYLIERVGRENPFRVPEGYFDTLADEVMARVDAAGAPVSRKARKVWLRPLLYAAASVCALFVSVMGYKSYIHQQNQSVAQQVNAHQPSEDSFEQAADYLMVDNEDIYACLASDY
jgi:hypothetical protein